MTKYICPYYPHHRLTTGLHCIDCCTVPSHDHLNDALQEDQLNDRFSLIMLNDSGVSLGIPLGFRGTIHAYVGDPKRRFNVTFTDTHANVVERED